MPIGPEDLQAFLQKIFQGHGVDARVEGDWVILPKPYARAQAAVVNETPHPNAVVVQLDVRIYVAFGRMILESSGGVGATRDDAVRAALDTFVSGSFHVILAAFFDRPNEQVEREEWVIGGKPRQVTIGPMVLKGVGANEDGQPATDTEWWGRVREWISAADLPEGPHWVRLYYGRQGTTTPIVEALLDNDEWPPIQDALGRARIPAVDGFFSARLFLAIQDGNDLAECVRLVSEGVPGQEEVTRDALLGLGLSNVEAELAASLIPLAFGRVLLAGLKMRMADEAMIMPSDGEPLQVKLDRLPLFRQAQDFARHASTFGTLERERFLSLTFRSPEVRAVNDALNAGSRPERLMFGSPVLLVTSLDAAAIPADAVRQTPAEGVASRRPERRPPPEMPKLASPPIPVRPWWKFW